MQWYQTQFVWGSHAPIKIEITLFSNPAHSLQCFVSACLYLKTYTFAPIINYVTAFPSYSITKCMCTYSSHFQPSICNQKALRAQKAPREFLRIISSLTHKMCHTLLQWHFQSADFLKIFVTVIFHVVVIYQKLLVQLLLQQFLSCLHNFRFKLTSETK